MKSYYERIIDHPEIEEWELGLIKKFVPGKTSLIDLGCGLGGFLLRHKEKFNKAVGVDVSNFAVRASKDKGLNVLKASVEHTGCRNSSFDIVRAKDVIEHLDNPGGLVKEASRILTKKGVLVIHTPTQFSLFYPVVNFWDDYTHKRPYTKKSLKDLVSQHGFKILFIAGYTAGRNFLERILGKIIALVFPHEWILIARKI